VDDQLGSPTMTLDLARAIIDLASAEADPGVYHAANEGACSWYDFAVDILDLAGMSDRPVARMSSADLDRPARRPSYSVLDCSRLTALRGQPMPHYRDALKRYLDQELDNS
jgi:dTDP-4-dehydrorhamnose reductase